jgi:hypothetical protein
LVGNLDTLRVELYIGTKDSKLNDRIFDYIKARQNLIENIENTKFVWTNESKNRTAKIGINNPTFGIESDDRWEECIEFLVKSVNTIAEILLPILEEFYEE